MPSFQRSLAALLLLSALLVVEGLCGAAAAQAGATYGGPGIAGNFVLLPSLTQTGRLGAALAVGDFDGDGDSDLAVGAPDDPTGGAGAGRVDVYLAHAGGLLLLADHFYGIAGSATGSALATGDFDDDGADEIAAGATGETVGAATAAGRVLILEWSVAQQDLLLETALHQGLALLAEDPEAFDNFGSDLASGDWNGDGYDDLAVGVPFEDVGASGVDHGAVDIFYGFANGLSDFGSQAFSQDSNLMLGQAAAGDNFGWSLTGGDFDGDGRDDLAIGIPGEIASGTPNAGGVAVLYGSANTGLSAGRNQLWTEESPGIPGDSANGEDFGWDLAAGDFNGDGHDDLGVGTPGDNPQGVAAAGAVYAIYGSPSGLTSSGSAILWAANLIGIPSLAGDRFGSTLVAGSFDGDSFADLAIASPAATVVIATQAGVVDVLLGSPIGMTAVGSERYSATGLLCGPAQADDGFGWGLAAGNFDADLDDDLFIGLPGRRHPQTNARAGLVQVLLSTSRIFGHNFNFGSAGGWESVTP